MRSRSKRLAAALLLVLVAQAHGADSRVVNDVPPTGTFTGKEADAAVAQLKKDPNLAAQRTIRSLKWVSKPEEKQKQRDLGWLDWIRDLLAWLTQNSRFLFWGVLAVLVGMLIVYLTRLAGAWSTGGDAGRIDAPSFVRDLDIRPESLPADIGAAARQLWDSGEQRSALALLYRGLLSRLVHVHQVPIRDSSTEGDCVALANRQLKDEERKTYVASLVRLWQRAVYGGESVSTDSVHALCESFASALDRPEETAAPGMSAAGASA